MNYPPANALAQTSGDVTAAPGSDCYRRKEAKPEVMTQPKGPHSIPVKYIHSAQYWGQHCC